MQLDFEPMSYEALALLTQAQRVERRVHLDALADFLDKLPDVDPRYWSLMRELVKLQSDQWPENA